MSECTSPAWGGSGGTDGRDSWCSPKWLADLIGRVDLDPCSNPRSHIKAATYCSLETESNGLLEDDGDGVFGPGCYQGHGEKAGTNHVSPDQVVFVNPPYARGQVKRWVKHYRHTQFIYLLRFDPSTEWFGELYPHCTHIWLPNRRINFEPPPGVKSSSNPFPHALYLRRERKRMVDPLLKRLSQAGYLLDVRLGGDDTGGHGRIQRDPGTGGRSREAPSAPGREGGATSDVARRDEEGSTFKRRSLRW